MKSGIIFLAGVYGVGKSTLSLKLSKKLHIPEYSASDLISKYNDEMYGKNKFVTDAKNNQVILTEETSKLLERNQSLLLSGHFCIFNKDFSVNILPQTFFEKANISKIILLQADESVIKNNLEKRDCIKYSKENLICLQDAEIKQAKEVSLNKNIPLTIYDMLFSDNDVSNVTRIINRSDYESFA